MAAEDFGGFEMEAYLIPVVLGIILIILGIQNMRGNISSLYSYHRKRVTEEDRVPFGKTVGTGTILIGCSLILEAVFRLAAIMMKIPILETFATVVIAIGLIIGGALIFYAMIKFNKGLF